ncbi:MAG: laminin sub domain 2, partial [Thermoleophilia bacterium]|nr:laminin sub domain 2 [Thermoleophilia bacterium]
MLTTYAPLRRRASGVLALLALVLLSVVGGADAKDAAAPHAATPKPPKTSASARIACTRTITTAQARRLPRAARLQLKRLGAYSVPGRRAGRGLRARATSWACLRSAKATTTRARLVRSLGTATAKPDLEQGAVTFPKSLDRPLSIDLPDGDSAGWRMVGAPALPATGFHGGTVYSGSDYDVVQGAQVGALTESIAVYRSQGIRTWSWKLEWSGGAAPRLAADGTVHYGHDVTIDRPFLQDAAGRRIRNLRWNLAGNVLSVRVDDRGVALPYVIDPASSYPQRIHPMENYVTGSTAIQGLISPPLTTPDTSSGAPATTVGEYFIWSGNTGGHTLGAPVTDTNAALPRNMNGIGACASVTYCNGALGWAQQALGGATLAAGPYSVQDEIYYMAASNASMPVTVALKAKLWKVQFDPVDTDILTGSPVAITGWSAAGPSQTWATGQQNTSKLLTATLNPLSLTARQLAPNEHVYVEYVLVVTDAGRAGSTFNISVRDVDTYIDFGGPATNSPGAAANLRIASAPLSPTGWTNDSTPTLRATLDDPDWVHHVHYDICSDPACATIVRSGNSPASQTIGSTNDSWTVPTALPDGTYYMRARTEEDGGDAQLGPWTAITGTTCTAVNVGPCDSFRVDTVLPTGSLTSPATGTWLRGTTTLSGTPADALSGLATVGVQWKRTSPSVAGPSSTGITCAGTTCTWDTTAVLDGTYDLILTLVDNAGNTYTNTKSNYLVDNTAPTWPVGSFSRDGAAAGDLTWTSSLNTLGSNWSAATEANGVTRYEYCLSSSTGCAGTIVKNWTTNALALNETSAGLPLVEGATYFSCVQAFDPAGNASAPLCSNGQTVDTLLPTPPTTVDDGPAADVNWDLSTSVAAANWTGGGDTPGSGVQRWEYCISTTAPCAGTIVKNWTSSGTVTNESSTALPLVQGEQYVTCVRVFDVAGNASASATCSDGQRVDTVSPPAPATVDDGPAADVDTTASTSTLTFHWATVVDPAPGVGVASGLGRYQYCITTTAAGTDCTGAATVAWTDVAPATATSFTRSGLALVGGTTYRTCIRAFDVAGNAAGPSLCSDGITPDNTAPTWPGGSVSRDGATAPADLTWVSSLSALGSNWTAAADNVAVTDYEYCLSTVTGCAGTVVKGWTAVGGPTLSQTSVGLTLAEGQLYFACVRALDASGNASAPLCSNGQTVDTVAPTPPTTVNDGPAADLTWLLSTSTAAANWTGGGDTGSGIQRWEFCVSTSATCAGTVVKTWTSTGVVASESTSALPLAEGERYFTCVRAVDTAGNASAGATCSNGQRVDTVAPPGPSTVNDGTAADISYSSSPSVYDINWTTVVDPAPGVGVASGLARYQTCITTTATGADCAAGATGPWLDAAPATATSATRTGLALTNGGTYRACVRAIDVATNASTPPTCSNGIVIDLGPPTASWASWTDNSAFLYSPGGNLLYFNPTAPFVAGSKATATVTATDPGAGMNHVDFPGLAAGAAWGAGGADSTVGPANSWTWDYTFSGGGAIGDPALTNATAYDNGGAFTGAPTLNFQVDPDTADPVVGTMPSLTGLQSTTLLTQSIPLGTDSQSGVGRYVVDVQYAPMVDGVCGAWDPWILGDAVPGAFGTASNGTTLTVTQHLNDNSPYDGVPDYKDSFCFRDQVRVYDNVDRMSTIPANGVLRADFADPVAAITGPAGGSSHSGTFTVSGTASDDWAGGGLEYTDTGSGIAQVTVTYQLGAAPVGNACPAITTFTGSFASQGWTCAWNTGALTDGLYTVRVQATDRSGRTSTVATTTYLLDNNAPLVTFHSWDDHGSTWMHAVGNVAWVNPTAPGGAYSLDARVTATDAGSGVATVAFPALGAGWTPGSATNAANTSPVPVANAWTMAYSFTTPSSLAAPGTKSATATDGAGNPNGIPFEVRLDGAAPTGVGASVVSGLQKTATVAVTLAAGTEPATESGLGSWRLEYDSAPIANDVCGSYTGTWSVATTGVGAAPSSYLHDVTALGSGCYQYRLVATDNVGNAATSAVVGARRVDLVAPTVSIAAPLAGSVQGGTVTVSGAAGDANSGINLVSVTWTRTAPSAGSGSVCSPATLTGSSPTWGWTCSWSTGALPDGTYTVTATSTDRATNVSTAATISITLDNFPPAVAFHSFAEATPYTYWGGTVGGADHDLWYNPSAPAGSYSFDVLTTATDPAGVSRVEYDGAGAGWTPGGAVGTQTVPVNAPTNDRFRQTYSFNTSGAVVDPPTLKATAFDTAGNPAVVPFELRPDTAAPAAATVSSPNGFVASTSVTVTLATGGDGTGSGIASWVLQRSTGTLSGASCVGWGAYVATASSGTGTFSGTRTDVVSDPGCFRYRIHVVDNVGNAADVDAAEQVKVDLVPPTGSIVLATGTNPAWQYLATPTRLYVNTAAGRSGTFTATTNASAASGVLDVNFPVLATGFSGDGPQPGPGPTVGTTYTWSALAAAPPTGLFARVRSNSLGQLDLPFEVIADPNAPTGAAPTHTGGYTTGSSVTVAFASGTDGTGSGVAGWQLQREVGTLAAGACTWTGTWTAVGPAGGSSYVDSGLAQASCEHYRVATTDRVGNVGTTAASPAIMVDQTGPVGATVTLAEGTNPAKQYLASPSMLWVNPTPGGPANFTATVTASDPESGTGSATFPSLGSTFTSSTTATVATYSWAAGATAPGVRTVTVSNGSGLTATATFTVDVDSAAPTGATLDQQNGFDTDNSVDVSFAGGSDGTGSGIGTWRIERRSAPYDSATATCSPWSGWTTHPLPLGQPTSPWVDTAVAQPTCYQYHLVEVDNVGNTTTTGDGTDTAKVLDDIFPPASFNLTLPTNPALPAITTAVAAPSCATLPTYSSSTPAFAWTASSDAESGLASYGVYVDGTGTLDATVPAPATTWTSTVLAEGAHTLGVRAVDNQANSTTALPAFPTTVRVDSSAPTAALTAPTAGSWTADTTPMLDWSTADANCLARVEVYLDGGLTTPAAVASGTEGDWTPAAPLAQGLHDWRVEAIDTLGRRTSSPTVSFGVDTTPPAAFSLVSPTAGQTVRGFVPVTWNASSDADSGLPATAAYEVWVDGVLRTAVGSSITTATIAGITNGSHTVYVKAIDRVGNATQTASITFTGYGAIPLPVHATPTNGSATNVVPALDWTWTTDGGPAPTSTDVVLDSAVDGVEPWPSTIRTIADPGDGVHTWHLVQHDPYTGTVTTANWTFTLDRTLPINPGPITRTATTLSWPAPVDPATPTASGINHQELWINDGVNPPTVTAMGPGVTSRSYGTLPDGIYTMFVRAVDQAGNVTDTPTITVTNDSAPPTAFTLVNPAPLGALPAITTGAGPTACETAPTFTSGTPTLSWSASSDATSGLAGYDILVDGTIAGTVAAPATSWTASPAIAGGT